MIDKDSIVFLSNWGELSTCSAWIKGNAWVFLQIIITLFFATAFNNKARFCTSGKHFS